MEKTDRGSQYLSSELRQLQDHLAIVPSYSKLAYPWDNAVIEPFFKYMKKEELNRKKSSVRLAIETLEQKLPQKHS